MDSIKVERILRDSFNTWMIDIWQGLYGAARIVADHSHDYTDDTLEFLVKQDNAEADAYEGVQAFRAIAGGGLFDANYDIGNPELAADASAGLAQHLGTSLDEVNEYLRTLDPVAVAQLIVRADARELEHFPPHVYEVE